MSARSTAMRRRRQWLEVQARLDDLFGAHLREHFQGVLPVPVGLHLPAEPILHITSQQECEALVITVADGAKRCDALFKKRGRAFQAALPHPDSTEVPPGVTVAVPESDSLKRLTTSDVVGARTLHVAELLCHVTEIVLDPADRANDPELRGHSGESREYRLPVVENLSDSELIQLVEHHRDVEERIRLFAKQVLVVKGVCGAIEVHQRLVEAP